MNRTLAIHVLFSIDLCLRNYCEAIIDSNEFARILNRNGWVSY